MPEGPEVKRTAEGLARAVSGKTITDIALISGRYTKKEPTGYQDIKSNLPIQVVGAGCHGKFIYMICKEENFIWSTLGMTGYWSAKANTHTRIKFSFSDGTHVFFQDQRNFGTLKFVRGKHEMIKKLKSLGPDMLAEDVSDHKFREALRKKPKWDLAKVLMNQSVVCGVGNYIKADSLWLARLSPKRLVSSLSDEELSELNRCIKLIIRESFQSGGATIQAYTSFDGEVGEYTQRMLVYGQKTDPDGRTVIREETSDKRTTHWVPEIQK